MALLGKLSGHFSTVWGCAFTPDNSLLASCASDENVHLWDVAQRKTMIKFGSHTGVVHSCAFSRDGQYLASCSWDKTTLIRHRCFSFQIVQVLRGHEYGISCLDFSPSDNSVLATCSWDHTICLWNVQPDREAVEIAEKGLAAAASVDWSGPNDDAAMACLAQRDKDQCLVGRLCGHRSPAVSCSFMAGGTALASSSWDRTVRLWDLQQAECQRVLEGHTDVIWSVHSNPCEPHYVVSCSRDHHVIVWDSRTGGKALDLTDNGDEVNAVSFSPNGVYLASGATDGRICVWDLRQAQSRPLVHTAHPRGIYGLRFSQDGSMFASSSSDTSIKLWDFHLFITQGVDDLAANFAAVSLETS